MREWNIQENFQMNRLNGDEAEQCHIGLSIL